jgi:hypothetical protein
MTLVLRPPIDRGPLPSIGDGAQLRTFTSHLRSGYTMHFLTKLSLVAVLAAGVIAALNGLRHGQSRPKGTATAHDDSNAMTLEIAELRRELQATKAIALKTRDPVVLASAQAVNAPPPEPDRAPELTIQDVRDALDARFHSEEYDRNWGADARQRLEKQVARALVDGSRVLATECRGSLCRVEIRHDDMADHQHFLREVSAEPTAAWEGPTMISLEEGTGDHVVSIGYFAREGTLLWTEADEAAF